jgi:hypothetical protein
MKQRILTVLAALVSAFLFIELSPSSLHITKLAWINWDSLTGRHGFYFKKRQWLADARTIVAGVRFLYECRTADQANPMDVVHVPNSRPTRPEISTNLLGIDRTETSLPRASRRALRAGQVMAQRPSLSLHGLPPDSRLTNFRPPAPVVWYGPVWRQSVPCPFSEHPVPRHSQTSTT